MDPVSNSASDLLPIQDSGFPLENLPEPDPHISPGVQTGDGVSPEVSSVRVGDLYIRHGSVHGDGSYSGNNLNFRIRSTPDGDTVRGSLSGNPSAAVEVTPRELRVGGSFKDKVSGVSGSIENRYPWNGGPPTTVLGVSAQVSPVTTIGVSSVDRPGNGKDQVDVNVTHNVDPRTRVSATFTSRDDGSTGGGVSVQGNINNGIIRADISAGGHNSTSRHEVGASVIIGVPLP